MIDPKPPRPRGHVICFDTPLTPADGILLLVGAECFLEGVAMEWEVSVNEFGLSMITYRHAMYRIRREQLAEYLRPVKT